MKDYYIKIDLTRKYVRSNFIYFDFYNVEKKLYENPPIFIGFHNNLIDRERENEYEVKYFFLN